MASSEEGREGLQLFLEIIRDVPIATLTTVDEDGHLRTRPMTPRRIDPDGVLWFFSRADTSKVGEIRRDPRISLGFVNLKTNRYATATGEAEIIHDRALAEELWDPIYESWFPIGPGDDRLALLKVRIEHAEFWDAPAATMPLVVPFVLMSHEPDQPIRHRRIDLTG